MTWASAARAAETPDARDKTLPCRPTIACTADIVPPGTVDLEAGALFRSLGPSSAAPPITATRQWTLPFLAKLTLAPWVQLQVGSNGLTEATGLTPQDYFDDLVVGAKFHLLDQSEWAPSVSLSAEASVPTFPGQGYLRTCAMGEAYYSTNAAPVAPRDGGLLFAFTHSPRSWLVFDMGADVGWFPSTRAFSLFVGMAIIPVVLWRPSRHRAAAVPGPGFWSPPLL